MSVPVNSGILVIYSFHYVNISNGDFRNSEYHSFAFISMRCAVYLLKLKIFLHCLHFFVFHSSWSTDSTFWYLFLFPSVFLITIRFPTSTKLKSLFLFQRVKQSVLSYKISLTKHTIVLGSTLSHLVVGGIQYSSMNLPSVNSTSLC